MSLLYDNRFLVVLEENLRLQREKVPNTQGYVVKVFTRDILVIFFWYSYLQCNIYFISFSKISEYLNQEDTRRKQ